ncbi:MAG TPA: HupE/UreJ family protein [Micropepsaceae bacterium]|nr:HupE/UreJ family protein [Micropepsaceae bacterium]
MPPMSGSAVRDLRRMAYCLAALAISLPGDALAHGMAGKDADFVAHSVGPQILPFFYLGAKHMATGYDHLLFVIGTVFFLYQLRHVAIYVTTFSIGHSITLLLGVLGGVHVNPFLVDAVIGLSVAYIAFDNLGGFKTLFGVQPHTKLAILVFGLVHGFGLATKVQELNPSRDGLAANMISFNVGVEAGQLLVLSVALALIVWWRKTAGFSRQAVLANGVIMAAGFALMEYQLAGYFVSGGA